MSQVKLGRSQTAAKQAADAARIRRDENRPEDPHIHLLPDPDDLLGLDDYLVKYRRVSRNTLKTEVLDQLTILAYLATEIDRRLWARIRTARDRGQSWPAIAEALGLEGRQAAYGLYQRLDNQFSHQGVRDEKAAAADRATRLAEAAAVARLADRIRALIDGYRTHPGELPTDLDESMDLLAGYYEDGTPTASPVPAIRSLVADARRETLLPEWFAGLIADVEQLLPAAPTQRQGN